jgi:small-conductance mechanosensitive channel
MYESSKSSLRAWNESTTDRTKLQHFYIAIAVLLLVVAGVIGLLNQNLGQQILAVAIAAAGIFIVNAIAWALLQSFVLFRLRETPVAREVAVSEEAPSKPVRKTTRKK